MRRKRIMCGNHHFLQNGVSLLYGCMGMCALLQVMLNMGGLVDLLLFTAVKSHDDMMAM